jgi:limonene-1,2-epoxide hydrolase
MEADLVRLAHASMQAWNDHDLDGYLSFFTPTASYIGPMRRVHGIPDIRTYMQMLMEAFPDEHATVDCVAVEGATVFVRYTDAAHHLGVMRWSSRRQIEPTGRRFTYEGVTELRFTGAKISYARDYFDLYELLFVQLEFPLPSRSASDVRPARS